MQSFLTPRRLLILVIVVLAISSLQPNARASWIARPWRGLVELFATPIRVPLHELGVAMRSQGPRELNFDDKTSPGYAMQRIAALQVEVGQLREENRRLRGVRSIIGESSALAQVDAAMTGVTGPRDVPILRIDRGTSSGVTKGRIVVTNFHLVGEVVSADLMTAQVKPITAARTKVLARLMPPGAEALREGPGVWLEWSPDQQAFVQQISSAVQIAVGDFAVFADEGSLPDARGFFLGQVVSVGDDPMDPYNFKRVIVAPTYRLEQLRRVTVLVPMEEGEK